MHFSSCLFLDKFFIDAMRGDKQTKSTDFATRHMLSLHFDLPQGRVYTCDGEIRKISEITSVSCEA